MLPLEPRSTPGEKATCRGAASKLGVSDKADLTREVEYSAQLVKGQGEGGGEEGGEGGGVLVASSVVTDNPGQSKIDHSCCY